MKATFLISLLVVTFVCSLSSCKKDKEPDTVNKPDNTSNSRKVKYELTGTYTGFLDIYYTNDGGTNTSVKVTSLPWSFEQECQSDVYTVAIGGNSEIGANLGTEGQTVTMKIYSGGVQKKTQTSTADEHGSIYLGTIAQGL